MARVVAPGCATAPVVRDAMTTGTRIGLIASFLSA
jgi:hypothetical protein